MQKILAVDDSKVALMQVKKYVLKKFPNCEILSTTNPVEGVEIAKEHQGTLDLVMVDFNMKEMNGLEFLEAIEGYIPLSQTVICTANLQKILETKVNEKGGRYLEKPLSQEKMDSIFSHYQQKAS